MFRVGASVTLPSRQRGVFPITGAYDSGARSTRPKQQISLAPLVFCTILRATLLASAPSEISRSSISPSKHGAPPIENPLSVSNRVSRPENKSAAISQGCPCTTRSVAPTGDAYTESGRLAHVQIEIAPSPLIAHS